MRRREVVRLFGASAASAALWPVAARSQQPMPIVGWLFARDPADPPAQAFAQAMRDLGYVDGQNIHIEVRYARGEQARMPALAAEIVARGPQVIVTNGDPAIRAVRDAAGAIPIVMAVVGDAVASGFAKSLARPGGNLTGLSNLSLGLVGKRLELLHEAAQSTCVALLSDPDWHLPAAFGQEAIEAAQRLGVSLRPVLPSGAQGLDTVFADIARQSCKSLIEMPSAAFIAARVRIVGLAARYKIAAIYETREFVDAGGLMSYGTDFSDLYRSAAGYVDRMLKGARPADLPIEQPTKFELTINLKAARELGLTVPPLLLARADDVIE